MLIFFWFLRKLLAYLFFLITFDLFDHTFACDVCVCISYVKLTKREQRTSTVRNSQTNRSKQEPRTKVKPLLNLCVLITFLKLTKTRGFRMADFYNSFWMVGIGSTKWFQKLPASWPGDLALYRPSFVPESLPSIHTLWTQLDPFFPHPYVFPSRKIQRTRRDEKQGEGGWEGEAATSISPMTTTAIFCRKTK